jgi:anti-sigma B factor antagonist
VADTPEPLLQFEPDESISVGTVANSSMLDGVVVADFGRELLAHINANKGVHLLLDFEQVEYLSSATLTELIKANDAAVAGGGGLRLCGLSPDIEKVFAITKFDKLFDIHPGEKRDRAAQRYKRSLALSQEEDAWEERHE